MDEGRIFLNGSAAKIPVGGTRASAVFSTYLDPGETLVDDTEWRVTIVDRWTSGDAPLPDLNLHLEVTFSTNDSFTQSSAAEVEGDKGVWLYRISETIDVPRVGVVRAVRAQVITWHDETFYDFPAYIVVTENGNTHTASLVFKEVAGISDLEDGVIRVKVRRRYAFFTLGEGGGKDPSNMFEFYSASPIALTETTPNTLGFSAGPGGINPDDHVAIIFYLKEFGTFSTQSVDIGGGNFVDFNTWDIEGISSVAVVTPAYIHGALPSTLRLLEIPAFSLTTVQVMTDLKIGDPNVTTAKNDYANGGYAQFDADDLRVTFFADAPIVTDVTLPAGEVQTSPFFLVMTPAFSLQGDDIAWFSSHAYADPDTLIPDSLTIKASATIDVDGQTVTIPNGFIVWNENTLNAYFVADFDTGYTVEELGGAEVVTLTEFDKTYRFPIAYAPITLTLERFGVGGGGSFGTETLANTPDLQWLQDHMPHPGEAVSTDFTVYGNPYAGIFLVEPDSGDPAGSKNVVMQMFTSPFTKFEDMPGNQVMLTVDGRSVTINLAFPGTNIGEVTPVEEYTGWEFTGAIFNVEDDSQGETGDIVYTMVSNSPVPQSLIDYMVANGSFDGTFYVTDPPEARVELGNANNPSVIQGDVIGSYRYLKIADLGEGQWIAQAIVAWYALPANVDRGRIYFKIPGPGLDRATVFDTAAIENA